MRLPSWEKLALAAIGCAGIGIGWLAYESIGTQPPGTVEAEAASLRSCYAAHTAGPCHVGDHLKAVASAIDLQEALHAGLAGDDLVAVSNGDRDGVKRVYLLVGAGNDVYVLAAPDPDSARRMIAELRKRNISIAADDSGRDPAPAERSVLSIGGLILRLTFQAMF